jgi:hypothetical protein
MIGELRLESGECGTLGLHYKCEKALMKNYNIRYKNLLLSFFLCILMSLKGLPQCNTTMNLALGRPAVASSMENAGTPASNAFDANTGTRWSSAYSDPQYIYVDLGAVNTICQVSLLWEAAYATSFQIDVSNDAVSWVTLQTITGNASTTNVIPVSGSGRYVRMYGLTRATGYGYSLFEFQVYGTAPTPACTTNLSLGRTATASSVESIAFPASNAVDNNSGTRWSSASSDPQYIEVDLGAIYTLCSVELDWESAYGSSFLIDWSDDNLSWTNAAAITGNTSLINTIPVAANARYVRMYGQTRATMYGYSLYEFKIFGNGITLPLTWLNFNSNSSPGSSAVRLNWSTTAELNTGYFDVERKTGNGDFSVVGSVPDQKNGGPVNTYVYIDEAAPAGSDLYRLKQVDQDGKFSYSKIIAVDVVTTGETPVKVYPNPSSGVLNIQDLSEPIEQLSLFTAAGKKIFNICCVAAKQSALSVSSFPTGIYILQITTASHIYTRKIVRQ